MNYEIKNEFIKAKINSFGAELNSLQKCHEDLEYIWQANPHYWGRHSPILFPIVGRLQEESYFYKNQKYSMSQHGFARDKEFELVKKEADFIEFRLCSDESSLKMYPFVFELFIAYKVEKNRLIVSYRVVNSSEEKILFSIGAHPAFNWPLKENEKKEAYFLEFENIKKTKRYFLNNLGLVYKAEELTITDNKIALNEALFKNDALIFNDSAIRSLCLRNTNHDHFIKVSFENFPYLGIWSKPSGAPFICIEPWLGVADEQNSSQKLEEKKGIITLENHSVFSCFYSIKV